MGDPRKLRRKYSRPEHLWRSERISEESELCKRYGLKNRKEIWKVKHLLRKFRNQSRRLLAMEGQREGEKEKKELIYKIRTMGLESKNLEDILGLTLESLLDRRLQTIVYKNGLANTIKQSRQFITHGHVLIDGRVVTIPSYFVLKAEEGKLDIKEHIKAIKKTSANVHKKEEKTKENEEKVKHEIKEVIRDNRPKVEDKKNKKEKDKKEEEKEKEKDKKIEKLKSKKEGVKNQKPKTKETVEPKGNEKR